MKVHEALNLYNLHNKPETLAKHGDFTKKFSGRYKFAEFWQGEDQLMTAYGTADILSICTTYSLINCDGDAEPFDPGRLPEIIQGVKEQAGFAEGEPFDQQDYSHFMTELKKFQQRLTKMNCVSMFEGGVEYDYGVLVCEAPVELFKAALIVAPQM